MLWLMENGEKLSLSQHFGSHPGPGMAVGVQSVVRFPKGDGVCLSIEGDFIRAGFFIGIARLPNGGLVGVRPKFSDLDVAAMLDAAFQESEFMSGREDVEALLSIDSKSPRISVDLQDDSLTPFLIAAFLGSMKRLLCRGLLRRYRERTDNLRERVRGRIFVEKNLIRNAQRGDLLHQVCRFQEFTPDIPENRRLKTALRFCHRYLGACKVGKVNGMETATARMLKAFAPVADTDANDLPKGSHHALFAEYDVALCLAELILKRFDCQYSSADNQQVVELPPFWINMPLLFEFYVFHRLRSLVATKNELSFQPSLSRRRQRPDFLYIPAAGEGWIIDAKYKKYDEKALEIDDIRQVCGYARMRSVAQKLHAPQHAAIPVLLIYPSPDTTPESFKSGFMARSFEEDRDFFRVYSLGIDVPLKTSALP